MLAKSQGARLAHFYKFEQKRAIFGRKKLGNLRNLIFIF